MRSPGSTPDNNKSQVKYVRKRSVVKIVYFPSFFQVVIFWSVFSENCVAGCKSYKTCTERDWGLFAEVRYFQLGGLGIPDELNQRFLKALVLQEENETEKLKQESQVIRKETQAQVSVEQHTKYGIEMLSSANNLPRLQVYA